MLRKLLFLIVVLGLTFVLSGVALAAVDDDDDDNDDDDNDDDDNDDDDNDDDDNDDDDNDDDDNDDNDNDDDDNDDDDVEPGFDATVEFIEPQALEPEWEGLFSFRVTYNEEVAKGLRQEEWINKVDLMMPSTEYEVDEENLTAPDPIHGGTGDEYEILKWEVGYDPTSVTITWESVCVTTSPVHYGDIHEGDFLDFEFRAKVDEDATDGFMWTLHGDLGTVLSGKALIGEQEEDDDDDNDDDDYDDDQKK